MVLLAAYNGAPWIGEQIGSILAQRDVALQVVVRDDGSTDGTQLALERFAGDERLLLQHSIKPSGSAAQNFLALIRERNADTFGFVALADQDDIWHADKLRRACDTLVRTGASAYSSATLAVWDDGRTRVIKLADAQGSHDFLFEGAGQGCTFVMTADFYSRARVFLSAHTELTAGLHFHDWALYALARSWQLQWCFDTSPSLKYRQHGHNDTGARNSVPGLSRRLSLVRRGWYRDQLRKISALCSVAAPKDTRIESWSLLLDEATSWSRRARLAMFCLRNGRRRRADRLFLVFASLLGWI